MSDDLDLSLSRPLEEPADAGFSAIVLARAANARSRIAMFEDIALILAAGIVVALLPLTGAGQAFAQAVSQLAQNAAFAMGCGLLLVSLVLIRALPE